MAKLSPTALSISVFSLVFSAGFWFLVIPELKGLQENLSESDSRQQATATSANTRSGSGTLMSQVQLSLTQSLMPSKDQPLDVTIQIESLAKSRGLSLSALQVGSGAAAATAAAPKTVQAQQIQSSQPVAANAKKVPIILTASGSYENVQRFAIDLTQLDRLIQIDQISVSTGAEGTTTTQITASAFYLP